MDKSAAGELDQRATRKRLLLALYVRRAQRYHKAGLYQLRNQVCAMHDNLVLDQRHSGQGLGTVRIRGG